MDNTTTNLSDFGHREREIARELLEQWNNGNLPGDFSEDNVKIMFNRSSGDVFLTNDNYDVCMMNGDDLESFYSCPICGHEGFIDEMKHNEEDEECQEYLHDIGVKK
jgi:hypothetical protein